MKKKYIYTISLLAVILLVALFFYSFDFSVSSTSKTIETAIQDKGNITVYFCPQDNCEGVLISFLESAQESLHCAIYDVGLPSLQDLLVQKSEQIEVKVVTDDTYFKKFNHSFVHPDSWGLQHNKFCVVDGVKFFSGSMNPTNNDAHRNNNNLLLIESKTLAQNYETEFQEMWQGTYKAGDRVLNPKVVVGSTLIKNYFCPEDHCAQQVKKALAKANTTIDFMTFSFTSEEIANTLLLKKMAGVQISGVMETSQVTEHSQYERLLYNGIPVLKDATKGNMHHKVFIIDNRTVVTGSFNPTSGGDTRNDENLLIIHNPEIALEFAQEFNRLFAEASS